MSIVQPESVLAKDGTITADSFDKLAVKLAGTSQSAEVPAFREAQSPGIVATAEWPPTIASDDEPIVNKLKRSDQGLVERRVLERWQPEDSEAGVRAHALLDIMAAPTKGSPPQVRALANDTLLRLIARMALASLRPSRLARTSPLF